MNIITTPDGFTLTSSIFPTRGVLDGSEVRTARWALGMARNELVQYARNLAAYSAADRAHLLKRIRTCRANLRKAEAELLEAQEVVALLRAREAQPVALTAHQVTHCIIKLTHIEAWLDRLSLSRPSDADHYTRPLMRDEAAWISGLLANAMFTSRRAQPAQHDQQAALTAHQVTHCITKLTQFEAWLDRLSLLKPADDDYHARLLMRDEVTWIRDLLANVAIHPVSFATN
jgi:hypothetical protein